MLAPLESSFVTLERECILRRRFRTQADAQAAIFEWIEGLYTASVTIRRLAIARPWSRKG